MIELLPPPPSGKTGWPWTEESRMVTIKDAELSLWPRISIITPSYNQGKFIEETIRSVLLQNYPLLEYIIIDGGSTDETKDIIKKYEPWISYWESVKDRGQSHAINKGFGRATGTLVNWICSDDMLCKDALNVFSSAHYSGDNFLYIGRCILIDCSSSKIGSTSSKMTTLDELTDIKNHWRKDDSIAQQSALYPLDIVNAIGGVKEENHYTMDYELWGELMLHGLKVINLNFDIGIYRWYEGQKTSYSLKVTSSLVKTSLFLIQKDPNLSFTTKQLKKTSVIFYLFSYYYHHFRSVIGIRRKLKKLTSRGI